MGIATATGTTATIATGGAIAAVAPASAATLGGMVTIGATSSLAGGIATRASYNCAYNLNSPMSNQLDYVLDPKALAYDMAVGGLLGGAYYGLSNINISIPITLKGSLDNRNLTGRAINKLKPNSSATGAHSTFKVDPKTGKITNYATWKPNPKNPSGFDEVIRYDGVGDPHYNKVTQEYLMPHVHDKTTPGKVRAPYSDEIPK